MGIEHRSYTGSAPHVNKRLCAVMMFFIGVLGIIGGFVLGRMARNEIKLSNEIISINLTIAAEKLYRKAKCISPKAVHHNDPKKITAKLLHVFHCTNAECGTVTIHNVADFVRHSINREVNKLITSIQYASAYLDSLR